MEKPFNLLPSVGTWLQLRSCTGESPVDTVDIDVPSGSDGVPEYGEAEFWETHYSTASTQGEEVFDWIARWADVRHIIQPLLVENPSSPVLHLGCGNSTLPEDMYDEGYTQQTCIDVSPAVIAHMKSRNSCRPSIRWITADATDLTAVLQNDGAFSLVIDKSTLDAFFCHEQHALVISKFLKEAFRLTASNGTYVSFAFHRPCDVRTWLRRKAFAWRVEEVALPQKNLKDQQPRIFNGKLREPISEYAYICSKQPTVEHVSQHWPLLLERVLAHPDSDLSSEDEESVT